MARRRPSSPLTNYYGAGNVPSMDGSTSAADMTTNRPARRVPGFNVDALDIAAGLRELKACGYDDPHTVMVIEYALQRWARGEEEAAQRAAIDRSFHGINLTCWIRVVAAARAHADRARTTKEQP